MLIQWNSNYLLNIEELDDQHHRLIDLLNSLNQALEEKKTRGILKPLFLELFDYAAVHFDTEEELMRNVGYPEFENHCRQHEHFFEQVVAFKAMADFEMESQVVIRDIADFLTTWLRTHIMVADQLFAMFYNPSALSIEEKADVAQCDSLLRCSFHKRSQDGNPMRQKWIQEYCNSATGSRKCFRKRFKFNQAFPPPEMAPNGTMVTGG